MINTCQRCGAPTVSRGDPYGFRDCTNPLCVENPRSEAARLDRRATIDAAEALDAETSETEDMED